MKWEYDVVKMLQHAIDLNAEDQIKLLASVAMADWSEVHIEVYDEHLFNEGRLYEALGKEDARTVLALNLQLQMLKALLAIFIGNPKLRLDREAQQALQGRLESHLRAVRMNEQDEEGKVYDDTFSRCDSWALGSRAPLTDEEKRIFIRRFLDSQTLLTVANEEKTSREKVRQAELRAEAKVRRILCRGHFHHEEDV
jgi:hypothetical protein